MNHTETQPEANNMMDFQNAPESPVDEVIDHLDAAAKAGTSNYKIDELNAAKLATEKLLAIINIDIKSVEQALALEKIAGLNSYAKQQGYKDWDSMASDLGYGKVADGSTASPVGPQESDGPVAKRSVDKTPKVYKYLLKEEYNGGKVDFKKGHNGFLKGTPPKDDNWYYKLDGKPDPKYYREATVEESGSMERIRDAYLKKRQEYDAKK